jgi:hypothetical protein
MLVLLHIKVALPPHGNFNVDLAQTKWRKPNGANQMAQTKWCKPNGANQMVQTEWHQV